MLRFEDIDFQKISLDDVQLAVDMSMEELNRLVIPADADAKTRAAMVKEAKCRAREQFAKHMAPKIQAEEDERKRKIQEIWEKWERLDDERTAAYQALEDALVKAGAAASAAAAGYPADRSLLPKRYSVAPDQINGCAALAKQQGEMIRKLRDKANEVAA